MAGPLTDVRSLALRQAAADVRRAVAEIAAVPGAWFDRCL